MLPSPHLYFICQLAKQLSKKEVDQRCRWARGLYYFKQRIETPAEANKLMHICPSGGCCPGGWSPEQETNERQMECLSEEGCKSRSKICKTGGDK